MLDYTNLQKEIIVNTNYDNEIVKKKILQDVQIKKFCAYGFLKNLKFFEPYLIIFLMSKGLNLFEIGILISIREVIVNLFEIPSGIIADYFGRKKELYLCFGFYIVSFGIFFMTNGFMMAMFAMMFFGLGEAFRSGTHKAMIYTYLDSKNWESEKTFVYGRTRSFSLIGSAISSVMGVVLILVVPDERYIFLFSIVPYILDLLLIISYPKFLDKADKSKNSSFKDIIYSFIKGLKGNYKLRRILVEEGMSEATFAFMKDLIGPIMEVIIVGSGVFVIAGLSMEDNLKIILGLVYAIFNLFGSYFSKRAYLIKGDRKSITCLYYFHIGIAVACLLLSLSMRQYVLVIVIYVALYILHSIRKPMFMDEVDNHIEKSSRATTISISSQIKSVFLMVFAPVLGFVADTIGVRSVMIILCVIFVVTIPLLKFKD